MLGKQVFSKYHEIPLKISSQIDLVAYNKAGYLFVTEGLYQISPHDWAVIWTRHLKGHLQYSFRLSDNGRN